MTEDNRRLAVLIDADNTSPRQAAEMFEELAGYGTLTVKRAYGDWTSDQLNGWKKELHKHAISPMQQFANTSGKNSTDSALIIDAMDVLYAGNVDGFVIVSSDADFTRLATRLRESGMTVYGLGQRKTPKPFQDACDKFTFLEVLRADGPEAAPADEGTVPDNAVERGQDGRANLQSMLTKALNKTASDDDDWSALGSLGSHLNRTDPSFDSRTYGFGKLSDLVKAQPFLETKTVTGSSGHGQLWVRVKGHKPAKTSAKKAAAKKAAAKKTPSKKTSAGKTSAASDQGDHRAVERGSRKG
jgi:hypothetical protein